MNKWLILLLAILAEVAGTTSLKLSDGFKQLWPTVGVAVGYGISFYLFSLTLRDIPVGVGYAIWSGVGLVLITLVGWLFFRQHLDLPALVGMGLILTGVAVMNVFSRSVPH
jgi:small multidrug resistance pump